MIGQLLTGRYLILERLGAGGFSETYLARDKYLPHHPLCVVKCLQLSSNNAIPPETAERMFEMEARLLERLGQHHNQIPTLFAYCHESEQTYLVQEYVEGENLGHWLAQGNRLTSGAAIKLLLGLLPVLEHLHAHRVIHRDIKPDNLIRRRRDGKLVLIDFGAACQLSDEESSTTPETDDTPLAVGTPGYMPDEQHLGMAQLNTDLYALGAMVIHLLTGVHPRQFEQDLISGKLNWQLYLRDQTIDPQLVPILDRMVHVNFRDRYQQAAEVLADLQALRIARHSPLWVEGWQKTARKMALPAAAMLLIGVFGGQYVLANSNQVKPLLNRLGQMFQKSDNHLTRLRDLSIQGGCKRMLIAPNNRVLVTVGGDHGLRLWSLPTGTLLRSLVGHSTPVTALTISPDSKQLVSGSEDGKIRLWDVDSGELLREFVGQQLSVTAIAISPDARTLVSGDKDGTLRLWNLQTGIRMQTLKLPTSEVTAVTFGATPDSLISASNNHQIQVWDLRSKTIKRTFSGHTDEIAGLQVVDNQTLFSFGKDRGLVWDLNREELALALPKDSANSIAASFSDRSIVTVHDNGSIRFWQRKSGQLVAKTAPLEGNLSVVLSSDHHYLVSWSAEKRLHIWQLNAPT